MRPAEAEHLADTAVKVLLVVTFLCERDGRVTVRGVSEMVGINVSTTHTHLRTLRRKGLVTWEDKKAATLRPLVRRVA